MRGKTIARPPHRILGRPAPVGAFDNLADEAHAVGRLLLEVVRQSAEMPKEMHGSDLARTVDAVMDMKPFAELLGEVLRNRSVQIDVSLLVEPQDDGSDVKLGDARDEPRSISSHWLTVGVGCTSGVGPGPRSIHRRGAEGDVSNSAATAESGH